MDPGTGLTILGTAVGSAKLVEKILGPTADYLGDGLKHWAEKRVKNVGRIFENAAKKLGDKINEPGEIPPRVLKGILDEGSFCDGELATEYFGGVLASSRSNKQRDDRGASFIKIISRLSNYQIRGHYVFYALFQNVFSKKTLNVADINDLRKMALFISAEEFATALNLDKDELSSFFTIMPHVIFGLIRESLLDEWFRYGNKKRLKKTFKNCPDDGLIVTPSSFGIELFFWSQGQPELHLHSFLESVFAPKIIPGVILPTKYKKFSW